MGAIGEIDIVDVKSIEGLGVELQPLGFKTLMEIMVRGHIGVIRETSYEMRARQRGNSKLKFRHWFDYAFHLLRLRRAARTRAARAE